MADPTSFSNFEQCLVTHISLDWRINFDIKCIEGNVTLSVTVLGDNVSKLVCRQINISMPERAYLNSRSQVVQYICYKGAMYTMTGHCILCPIMYIDRNIYILFSSFKMGFVLYFM